MDGIPGRDEPQLDHTNEVELGLDPPGKDELWVK